jgi:FlaA1/EpsC-like NDP-sugar epimerase
MNNEMLITLERSILTAIVVYGTFFSTFKIYSSITRYENGKDYLVYIFIAVLSSIVSSIMGFIFKLNIVNLKSHLLSAIIISMSMIAYRVIIRMVLSNKDVILRRTVKCDKTNIKNVLIIGAGSSARDIIKSVRDHMKNEYNIIGMIDDNRFKLSYNISGVKVLGDRNDIISVCEKNKVDVIFFTISKIAAIDKKEILDFCQNSGAKVRILPSTEDYIKNSKNILDNLKDVEIEDVLYRDPIVLDNNNISKLIEDNVILVTGGGGSIGSELCRQIMTHKPKKLVILDIYENNLYDIEMELKSNYNPERIDAVVASVREIKSLDRIFKKYNPYLVFHAAAHKHVPLMENSPLEAIKNNVFGTYNVVNMCDEYNVNKCILISSDKAVNPTNVMGATKRLCEMIIQAKNKVSKTEFVAVRFGNVLGSNGSVVPLFKKQIAAGGPITVTDKEITRFFMTIPEAVQLILQAITYANGGEIFVLDMGKPVKIYDLAVTLIKLSGLEPIVDIPIEIIGLRPGEKLYEELLMEEEGLTRTNHEKIFIAKPMNITMDSISKKLNELNNMLNDNNYSDDKLKDVISKVVPTYVSNPNKKVV